MPSEAIENPLSVTTATEGGQTVVGVSGEVDAASADTLRNAIFEVIDGDDPRVTVDMGEVSFMDSSGLRVLIAGYKAAEQAGGALTVRNPSDVVQRLLEITGQLDRFVPGK
ncbi:MAG TPA: STAS domain-containing protein [Acidimicrobiales bacterium]|nr:STAS domain-containing protein [Acidimicrobiales bacterium]